MFNTFRDKFLRIFSAFEAIHSSLQRTRPITLILAPVIALISFAPAAMAFGLRGREAATYQKRLEKAKNGVDARTGFRVVGELPSQYREGISFDAFISESGKLTDRIGQEIPDLLSSMEARMRMGRPPYLSIRNQDGSVVRGSLIDLKKSSRNEIEFSILSDEAKTYVGDGMLVKDAIAEDMLTVLRGHEIYKIRIDF